MLFSLDCRSVVKVVGSGKGNDFALWRTEGRRVVRIWVYHWGFGNRGGRGGWNIPLESEDPIYFGEPEGRVVC